MGFHCGGYWGTPPQTRVDDDGTIYYKGQRLSVRVGGDRQAFQARLKDCELIEWNCSDEPEFRTLSKAFEHPWFSEDEGEIFLDFAPHSFVWTVQGIHGGLIFHPRNGGSGGAPEFSVTLTPTFGWSIHT